MGHLLLLAIQFLRRNLLLFTLIVLALVAAPWIKREWGHIQRIVDELPALRAALADVNARQASLAQALAGRVEHLSGAPVRTLDAEMRALDNEIKTLQQEKARRTSLLDAVRHADSMAARLQEAAMLEVKIELRRQARAHLLALRAHAMVLLDRQAALDVLEQRRLAHVGAYAAYQRAHRELIKLQAQADAGWFARIRSSAQRRELEKATTDLLAANNRAHAHFLAQQTLLKRLPSPGAAAAFRIDEERLASASVALQQRLSEAEHLAAQSHVWQAYLAVRPVLPAAFATLLGWWLVPAAMRTLFYFVLAPQAARRPPIVIGKSARIVPASPGSSRQPGTDSARIPERISARISAVSQQVTLAPGHDMLIRPEYCQSQPAGIVVKTTLLFDWRHWLTSIAARLWMLKHLRSTQEAQIVVSSTVDALDEVALVRIAAGEALVLQPRGLVGMMYEAGQRPAIRSHWRIGTLHAWLTLQLRYLSFEGPATLIVKGCRGVRLERAVAGRTISQEMTLGFSADARYATVRAEPFLPYLQGAQPLFHDKFEGSHAYYLYEEVPRNAQPQRRPHNPLDMLLDAGLKAFGI